MPEVPKEAIILLSGIPATGKSSLGRTWHSNTASRTTTWSAIHSAGPARS
jgi:hypothetical protein